MTLNAKTLIELFRVPLKGQIWPRASNLTDPKKRTWHMHGMMGVYGCPKSSGAISQSIHQFPVFGFIIWAKGLDLGGKNSNARHVLYLISSAKFQKKIPYFLENCVLVGKKDIQITTLPTITQSNKKHSALLQPISNLRRQK